MTLRKKFGKQYYYYDSEYRNRDRAYSQAGKLRKVGNKAKVKREGAVWVVWVRSPED